MLFYLIYILCSACCLSLLRNSVERPKLKKNCLDLNNNVFHTSLNFVACRFVPHLVFISDHHYVLPILLHSILIHDILR